MGGAEAQKEMEAKRQAQDDMKNSILAQALSQPARARRKFNT
jgi:DNA-binding TFAR19-related protein (PDSD5 family)